MHASLDATVTRSDDVRMSKADAVFVCGCYECQHGSIYDGDNRSVKYNIQRHDVINGL